VKRQLAYIGQPRFGHFSGYFDGVNGKGFERNVIEKIIVFRGSGFLSEWTGSQK
jgi:hypothetical protein